MQYIEIHIKGHIDRDWTSWISGLTTAFIEGETVLTGSVRDQAALYGFLARLADLGMEINSTTIGQSKEIIRRNPNEQISVARTLY
jgi:hypothetical protein